MNICKAYLADDSLLTIAQQLNEKQIEYMPGVLGWNKSRIKRIIEDERYLGTELYPAILDEKTYFDIQNLKSEKNTQKKIDRKSDIFQISVPIKCPVCGCEMYRRHDSRCKCKQRWICQNDNCRTLIPKTDKS